MIEFILIFIIFLVAIYYSKKFNIFLDLGSIPISYKPPYNLTILEVALLKDNFLEFEEITPAILELINLGFIELDSDSKGYILKKAPSNSIRLPKHQILLLHSIFKNSNFVPIDAIRFRSYHYKSIEDETHNSLSSKGLYIGSLKSIQKSLLISFVSLYMVINLIYISYYYYKLDIEFNMYTFTPILSLIFIGYKIIFAIKNDTKFYFFTPIILSILSIAIFIYYIKDYKFYLFLLTALILILSVVKILYPRVSTLTKKGIEAKREICGLKEFIKRADSKKIRYLQKEDKEYLNRILPYAILFNLGEHFLKIYKAVEDLKPNFNDSLDEFIKRNLHIKSDDVTKSNINRSDLL